MDIEIITIGDEILTGHTVDSNAAFMAERLLDIGYQVKYISSTGDSLDDMEEAFRLALSRAQLIITTGGLGPTDDDNTKKAIVKVFKRNLIYHEEILEDIKKRFDKRGIVMPPINQNQALLPQGAEFFPNKYGSAVGICIAEQNKTFISLPGVPFEMQQIFTEEILPYIAKMNEHQNIKIIKFRTTGIVESKLAELIKPKYIPESGVKLAYLPTFCGVDLRLVVTDENDASAVEKINNAHRIFESIIGKYIYGKNNETLPQVIGQLLKDNDKTLSVAESCTAGRLGSEITSVAGSSAWFEGGIIAYSNNVKINSLKVDQEIIDTDGAVSEKCAVAMVDGIRNITNSDYALSITGIAGPDGGDNEKPVGTTWIGLSSIHGSYARKFSFGNDRESNQRRAVFSALELLRREILDIK
jgi:nicotinamide-nucleotide amidase